MAASAKIREFEKEEKEKNGNSESYVRKPYFGSASWIDLRTTILS
jgi:hypothetical protein